MSQIQTPRYRFVALNVGKGARGRGGSKVLAHYRVFVVDADVLMPNRVWLAMQRNCQVFVPEADGSVIYAYELVLGRKPTDRERILYNNTDPLDLRRANLSYVNKYDPTIPQAVFKPCPGFSIERLPGFPEATLEAYQNYEALKKTQRQEHGWAVGKATGSMSKHEVLSLLEFYSQNWTDEEIEYHTDKRLGTSMDDCASFIREDLQHPKVPTEAHIRNILKGKALRLQGQDALYAKIAKLLPTYKSLLVPLSVAPMFKPIDPTLRNT